MLYIGSGQLEHGAAANYTVSESMGTVASPAGSAWTIILVLACSGLLSPVPVLVISVRVFTAGPPSASSTRIAFFTFCPGLLSPSDTILVVRVGVLVGTGLAGFGFALFLSATTFFIFVVRIAIALSVGTRLAFLTFPSPANTSFVIFIIGIGVVIISGGTGPSFLTFPSSTTIRVIVGIGIGAATTATRFPACRRRTYRGWVILRVEERSRDILASDWIDATAGLHPEAHSIPRSAANRNAL